MNAPPDNARSSPASAQGWWAVTVFATIAVISYTDRQVLSLLVDPLHRDLGVSDTQLSVLQGAAFAVLYSFVGLPLGRLADVVPRKRLLIAAVAIWSAGTLACGLAQDFGQMFAARLLVGIGEAGFAPSAVSLIGDYFAPDRRATALGFFFTGIVIGSGSAIAIGGALLSLAEHGAFANIPFLGGLHAWRIVLVLAGLAGIPLLGLLVTLDEPVKRHFHIRELGARLDFAAALRPFRARLPLLFPLYAAMALCAIVDYAVLSWSPALLARRFGFSPGEIGATLGAISIAAGLIGTPAAGILIDWYTRRHGMKSRVRLAFLLALLGLLGAPVGLMPQSSAVLAAVFCWIFISSMLGIVSIATVLDMLPGDARGFATSTIAFSNTIIGLGLGPTLVAIATDHLYGAPSSVGIALSTVAAPAILFACVFYFSAAKRWNRMEPGVLGYAA